MAYRHATMAATTINADPKQIAGENRVARPGIDQRTEQSGTRDAAMPVPIA